MPSLAAIDLYAGAFLEECKFDIIYVGHLPQMVHDIGFIVNHWRNLTFEHLAAKITLDLLQDEGLIWKSKITQKRTFDHIVWRKEWNNVQLCYIFFFHDVFLFSVYNV